MIFEWSEEKRRINLRKHGFDFRDCAAVFNGHVVTILDDRYDYGERRFLTVGLLRDRLVAVAHTEYGDTRRIISMRKADRDEQTSYFQSVQN